MVTTRELAQRIKKISEIQGQFRLRSGKMSSTYFDKFLFESDPILLGDITQAMVPLIPEDTEVLCGLEMGGIPVVTMLSHQSKLPAAFIRKERKKYGTCKYAEGPDLKGKRIVLVEDVVSSGGAILDYARMLRSDGIDVNRVLCVIDRQTGGVENLNKADLDLVALLKADDLN